MFGDAETLLEAMELGLRQVSSKGHLALTAYLDRVGDADVARLRPALAKLLSGRPVTFGWGPRFLPSTGQFHKGGPQDGVFLQITGAPGEDLPVPGKPYTFGALQMAQALRDLGALTRNDRPVLRLHLTDRKAGTEALLTALSA